MCRRNEMILIVAGQQNGHALGRYDLENEIQNARLDFVRAAKLVDGRVHPQKSRERGCFRCLVWSCTVRRMIAAPVSLRIREGQQSLVDFVLEEINKNRTPYSNVVAMHDDFRRKREFVHEGSVLAPTVPQQAPVIFEGKAAVLERNQGIVQRNVITCPSSDFEIGVAENEFRSLQRTRNRQNSWIHVRGQ